jgi:hypothetical protein
MPSLTALAAKVSQFKLEERPTELHLTDLLFGIGWSKAFSNRRTARCYRATNNIASQRCKVSVIMLIGCWARNSERWGVAIVSLFPCRLEVFVPFVSDCDHLVSLSRRFVSLICIDRSVSVTESADSKPAEPLGPDRGMMLNSGGFLFLTAAPKTPMKDR